MGENQGFTLVELVVSMAILGLFLAASAAILPHTFSVYTSMQGYQYGEQVSELLADELRVRLSEAAGESGGDAGAFSIADDAGELRFRDAAGKTHELSVKESGDGRYLSDNSGLLFDPKVYMGYSVEELRFYHPGAEYPDNVICVAWTLKSELYGSYSSTEFLKIG